jgi:hypothetical protein
VVQRVLELGALAVMGNHDAHLLDVRAGQSKKAHHTDISKTLTEAQWKYLDQLPLWLDFPELNALVVHAGFIPTVELARQPRHVLLNMRSIDAEGRASMRADGGVPWASTQAACTASASPACGCRRMSSSRCPRAACGKSPIPVRSSAV